LGSGVGGQGRQEGGPLGVRSWWGGGVGVGGPWAGKERGRERGRGGSQRSEVGWGKIKKIGDWLDWEVICLTWLGVVWYHGSIRVG